MGTDFSKHQITIETRQEIGNGSFSKVVAGTYKKRNGTTTAVALKVYTADAPREYEKIAKEEMRACAALKHENIVEFYGVLLLEGSLPLFQQVNYVRLKHSAR